jgi:Tol biopolymer transport system component
MLTHCPIRIPRQGQPGATGRRAARELRTLEAQLLTVDLFSCLSSRVRRAAIVVAILAGALPLGAAPIASTAPPGPGRILFVEHDPTFGKNLSALFSVNPNGTGKRRIASGLRLRGPDRNADCRDDRNTGRHLCIPIGDAQWSPNGRRVLFIRDGLYIAKADGSAVRRLARGEINNPDWSPDGQHIVFGRFDKAGRQLYVASTKGRLRRLVKVSGDLWPWLPRWSPDGKLIAFVRFHYAESPDAPDQIWVIRPDGTGRRLVATGKVIPDPPDWSADSQRIGYVGGAPGDVYVVERDGQGKMGLSQSHDVNEGPTWGPVGTAIAYVAEATPCPGCLRFQVLIHRTITSQREQLDDDPVAHQGNPIWSPDGSSVAFSRLSTLDTRVDEGLYVKKLDGGPRTLVVAGVAFPLDWR